MAEGTRVRRLGFFGARRSSPVAVRRTGTCGTLAVELTGRVSPASAVTIAYLLRCQLARSFPAIRPRRASHGELPDHLASRRRTATMTGPTSLCLRERAPVDRRRMRSHATAGCGVCR